MANNKYTLRYLPLFYEDLEEKIVYIAEKLHNVKAANDLLDEVEQAILERQPVAESFEPYHSLRYFLLRHMKNKSVKAEENLRAKSLRAFCDKYNPDYAVRTSMSDYREQDWMTNIPLYNIDRITTFTSR